MYLEIEDNFMVPEVFSCDFDFILTATGLFSVVSLGLFAPDFLSKIAKKKKMAGILQFKSFIRY